VKDDHVRQTTKSEHSSSRLGFCSSGAETHGIDSPPDTVYFVRDTPESDIRGTNEFSKRAENTWYYILVGTGVFQGGTTPGFPPRATVDSVFDTVKHGMTREYRNAVKNAAMNVSAAVVVIEE
jgi:hypothetical protein